MSSLTTRPVLQYTALGKNSIYVSSYTAKRLISYLFLKYLTSNFMLNIHPNGVDSATPLKSPAIEIHIKPYLVVSSKL